MHYIIIIRFIFAEKKQISFHPQQSEMTVTQLTLFAPADVKKKTVKKIKFTRIRSSHNSYFLRLNSIYNFVFKI